MASKDTPNHSEGTDGTKSVAGGALAGITSGAIAGTVVGGLPGAVVGGLVGGALGGAFGGALEAAIGANEPQEDDTSATADGRRV